MNIKEVFLNTIREAIINMYRISIHVIHSNYSIHNSFVPENIEYSDNWYEITSGNLIVSIPDDIELEEDMEDKIFRFKKHIEIVVYAN